MSKIIMGQYDYLLTESRLDETAAHMTHLLSLMETIKGILDAANENDTDAVAHFLENLQADVQYIRKQYKGTIEENNEIVKSIQKGIKKLK